MNNTVFVSPSAAQNKMSAGTFVQGVYISPQQAASFAGTGSFVRTPYYPLRK